MPRALRPGAIPLYLCLLCDRVNDRQLHGQVGIISFGRDPAVFIDFLRTEDLDLYFIAFFQVLYV